MRIVSPSLEMRLFAYQDVMMMMSADVFTRVGRGDVRSEENAASMTIAVTVKPAYRHVRVIATAACLDRLQTAVPTSNLTPITPATKRLESPLMESQSPVYKFVMMMMTGTGSWSLRIRPAGR
tara:strand:- start:79 stop:447 length:369 start_codon:yes stop_codon:yes gene_type:complete